MKAEEVINGAIPSHKRYLQMYHEMEILKGPWGVGDAELMLPASCLGDQLTS